MADSMRSFVARRNIQHYERVLKATTDAKARLTVEQLLAEARDELDLAQAEDQFAHGNALDDLSLRARCWRLKAAEYREIADTMESKLAAATYGRLAQDYDRLADRADTKLERYASAID